MDESLLRRSAASRDAVLSRLRASRQRFSHAPHFDAPDEQSPIYRPVEPSLEACFEREITAISGECSLCPSVDALYDELRRLMAAHEVATLFVSDADLAAELRAHDIPVTSDPADFSDMQGGATRPEFLVARTGSVVVCAAGGSGRRMNVFPPVHFVLARKSQLVPYLSDALDGMRSRYPDMLPSAITCITGPSRTADIEKTLVLGAHGPKAICVLIDLSA